MSASPVKEERTSRCGWEVLTLGRRLQSRHNHQEPLTSPSSVRMRTTRGVLSWLNLMSEGEDRGLSGASLGRSMSRLDQEPGELSRGQGQGRRRTRTQELCDRWSGLALDIDEILEAPLETSLNKVQGAAIRSTDPGAREFRPFIQTDSRQCVVPGSYKAEPLHLFHTHRNRKHVLHCYEYLLMRTLDDDDGLWQKLCERFGHCDQCLLEGGRHSHKHTKDPFSINSIHPDLWFLAITLKESKDKLIHFIRSELPKRKDELFTLPGAKTIHTASFLSSYLNSFNFVEMYLDSIFKFGDVSVLPKELFRCSNIRTLSLRNNFLDTIPPDIGRLNKLERLFLTNNKLQNKSIPFTIAFCQSLTELYIDNNLLDALPGIFLRILSLERVHRHGNHNYFKATFMWYHTDVNDRILECPPSPSPGPAERTGPGSLQHLAASRVIQSRLNFFRCGTIPSRIKDYISGLCEGLELCSNCSSSHPQSAASFKVFTFKNPYLGNTCVPFQHWACSLACAREIEVPARREQLLDARLQDWEYERYVRESLSRLRPSQRTLSATSLGPREPSEADTGSLGGASLQERGVGAGVNVSCGIL